MQIEGNDSNNIDITKEVDNATDVQELTQEEDTGTDVKQELETESIEQENNVDDNLEEKKDVLTFNTEEDILEYIKSKEELLSKFKTTEEVDIPEDIKKYLEYKKETNRSYDDFLMLQKDLSDVNGEYLIKQMIKEKNPHYTNEDIEDEYEERFSYDEDYDDEKTVRKAQREFKRAEMEAKAYYESLKEKYKIPVGSTDVEVPLEYKEAKAKLDEFINESKSTQEVYKKQNEYFLSKTDELFSDDFKGFDFKIGEETVTLKPSNVNDVKETQKNVSNFLNRFLDENGLIKDPEGYHKALYVAMNYETVLKDVYETVKARVIEEEVKSSKNITMGIRQSAETIKSGFKMSLVD